MITKLEILQQIEELTQEGHDYFQQKLAIQKNEPKTKDRLKRERALDAKKKKCAERVKNGRHVLDIIENMSPETIMNDRNMLLIKLRTIQEREPVNPETNQRYSTDEQKNPEVKKILKAHYDMYKYDKLQKQYRALSYILKG